MELELGRGKRARRAYGFDEVALVPGRITINPDEIDISTSIDGTGLTIPFLAAAMDGVVDTAFAAEMGRLGGLAVLNLDGVQTRYEDPSGVLREIADSPPDQVNTVLQRIYTAPVLDGLIGQRIEEVKRSGAPCAVSTVPGMAERRAPIAGKLAADLMHDNFGIGRARKVMVIVGQ